MKLRKIIGVLVKYTLLFGLLGIYVLSLYRGVTTITDEMERGILIWTDVLMISVIFGIIGSLLVQDKFGWLVLGKAHNIVDDLVEQDSEDFSVAYNGLYAGSFFVTGLGILFILYIATEIRSFLICCTLLSIIYILGTAINILAPYIQTKQNNPKLSLSKFLDPIVLPIIISILLILITNQHTVGFVYENLYAPKGTISLILALIVLLCYVLAMAFCHFSNLYCMIAFAFVKKDPRQIQAKIDAVLDKNAKREDALRQITGYVNEKAEQVGFFRRFGLAVRFLCSHIKAYCQEWSYAASYLLLFGNLKITELLGGLLEEDRIRTNGIRFCEITVVLELLVMDMLLFIYLGSEDPCSRFFELLSTVIIIPILLSSLANLKTKKQKKE